jgi:oxepin-CoA hydrolase/3-oxo-5,6-dehydrosuberyl-CoA semialdehyde dehydrogenase
VKTLRSHVGGRWFEAAEGFAPLVDPSTEEEIAQISSAGLDFAAAVETARNQGGPALRAMSFIERGALLKAMSKALREHRDELLELSRRNNGTTRSDGAFDIDGAGGTLAYYAAAAKGLGERRVLLEGDKIPLSREGGFWGRHLWVPRQGIAVHINAFNFPAWGFAEKAACALLAGMPVITKPASSTAMVAHRCVEIVIEAGILPPGALQLVCGSTGNLLDLVGPQDVLAFTGSADTSLVLRQRSRVQAVNARFNVEADSLNAAVLGPDVEPDSATMDLFLREVVREMTRKAGQKCTAVRRLLIPAESMSAAQEALIEKLDKVVTGNPGDETVTMGPLATARQLASAVEGVAALRSETQLIYGNGERVDGVGSPAGKGFFLGPTLLRLDGAFDGDHVHQHEVFAPVATLMPYDGTASQAAAVMALAGGTLVTSAYSDESEWVGELLAHGGSATGRVYVGSEESAAEAPGSGAALPQTLHGGPGRAGGGEELGGLIGVQLYLQRLALQGGPSLVSSFE